MDLSDRLLWFLLGAVVGAIVGYIVRAFQKKSGEQTANIVPVAALMITVLLTVYAAAASQTASNRVDRIAKCNQKYLLVTIDALNERTVFNRTRADANVELQRAQAQYLRDRLEVPPLSETQLNLSLSRYFKSLQNFIMINGSPKQDDNPYPTPAELERCSN